ncbi:MAG: nitroreductase family protein [Halanaerobiaceae bacterium]
MIEDLIKKNRSCRRFNQEKEISSEVLVDLIKLARYSPSAANKQPLKYILSSDKEKNEKIFPHLSWAGYLKDWSGPVEGEKPSAYIVMLKDNEISQNCDTDAGIACQSILLGAREKGLGGCIFGAINRDGIRDDLQIEESFDILYVIALGEPGEEVVLETADPEDDIKYYRDENGVHHVPKRPLENLILDK